MTLSLAGSGLAADEAAPRKRFQSARETTHDKISPSLKQQSESAEMIPVLIVMKGQPQKQIFRRHEGSSEMRLQVAHSNYRRLAGNFASERTLREAHEQIDQVSLEVRQAAAQEIELAVGPDQQLLNGRLAGLGATQIERYRATKSIPLSFPPARLPI